MPAYLNPYQPRRPFKNPTTGEPLMFRTYPRLSDSLPYAVRIYQTAEPINRVCQMMLYRWCRSEEFVEAPGCADLWEYLFAQRKLPVSKRHLGMCIVNALDYECRKLKGVTKDNPKMKQIYMFNDRLELQYGLEYMICVWLRKFLNDMMPPSEAKIAGDHEEARARVSEELDILAETPYRDFYEIYVEPLFSTSGHRVEEPDWKKLIRQAGAELDDSPVPLLEIEPRKLKSYR